MDHNFARESGISAIESGINELQKQLVAELHSGVDCFPAFLLKILEQMEAIVSVLLKYYATKKYELVNLKYKLAKLPVVKVLCKLVPKTVNGTKTMDY